MDFVKFSVEYIDENFDVFKRLKALEKWEQEYQEMDASLEQRIVELTRESKLAKEEKVRKQIDHKKGLIGLQRRRIKSFKVRVPLDVHKDVLESPDARKAIWEKLLPQYAQMTRAQMRLWVKNNLYLLMTEDLQGLADWMREIFESTLDGEMVNLLVGGEAGVGKTRSLDWLSCLHLPELKKWYTSALLILTEAMDDDKSTKSLLQQIILGTAENYLDGDSAALLLDKAVGMIQTCGTLLLIVDEINNLREGVQRRRLIDLMNRLPKTSVIGSAVNPLEFREGNSQLATRFPFIYPMKAYKGDRMTNFLGKVDLILPFPARAYLGSNTLKIIRDGKTETIEGSAPFIDRNANGSLRTAMTMIFRAAKTITNDQLAGITPDLLYKLWPSEHFAESGNLDEDEV